MRIREFGSPTNRKLLLIHGFQCPWQIWEPYIQHYQNEFHVIVPVLSGHDPDKTDEFHSFTEDAKAVEDYLVPRYGREFFAVYGMSMGGVLAATLWQNGRLTFEKVVFDGSPLVSLNGVVKDYMQRFYLDITHKCQKRDTKTLRQATKAIVPKERLEQLLRVLDQMTDATIVNSLNSIAEFGLRTDVNLSGAKIYFFHGTAMNEMLARKSAKQVQRYYPTSVIKCFKGKFHCENALFYPQIMIAELDNVFME